MVLEEQEGGARGPAHCSHSVSSLQRRGRGLRGAGARSLLPLAHSHVEKSRVLFPAARRLSKKLPQAGGERQVALEAVAARSSSSYALPSSRTDRLLPPRTRTRTRTARARLAPRERLQHGRRVPVLGAADPEVVRCCGRASPRASQPRDRAGARGREGEEREEGDAPFSIFASDWSRTVSFLGSQRA